MTVHLIKLCVGIESMDHLARVQAQRRKGAQLGRHFTRNTPRRRAELLDGGSIYWVIRGFVMVRQAISGVERMADGDGRLRCALLLDPRLVRTVPRAHRPFQGWRYLEADAAPPDAGPRSPGKGGIPAELAAELEDLGLL